MKSQLGKQFKKKNRVPLPRQLVSLDRSSAITGRLAKCALNRPLGVKSLSDRSSALFEVYRRTV